MLVESARPFAGPKEDPAQQSGIQAEFDCFLLSF
jgi:hypothetical protein